MILKRFRREAKATLGIRTLVFSLVSITVMTVFSAALVNGNTLSGGNESDSQSNAIDSALIDKFLSIATPEIIIEASKQEETIKNESSKAEEPAESSEAEQASEEAEPEPPWTEEACSIVMYLTANCNVRAEPNVNSEAIDLLSKGTQVTVVAKTNKEFCKIENGGFVSSKYLTETAPPVASSNPTTTSVVGTTGYAQLDELIQGIFNRIFTPGMSDAEKIRACYVYIIDSTSYQRGMPMPGGFGDTSVEGSNSYVASAAYGCLTTGKGSCNRYSAAFVSMMRMLGYEANYVKGLTKYASGKMDGHAWAEVIIGGTAYIFDPQVEDSMIARGESDGYSRYWKTYAELSSKYIKY